MKKISILIATLFVCNLCLAAKVMAAPGSSGVKSTAASASKKSPAKPKTKPTYKAMPSKAGGASSALGQSRAQNGRSALGRQGTSFAKSPVTSAWRQGVRFEGSPVPSQSTKSSAVGTRPKTSKNVVKGTGARQVRFRTARQNVDIPDVKDAPQLQ